MKSKFSKGFGGTCGSFGRWRRSSTRRRTPGTPPCRRSSGSACTRRRRRTLFRTEAAPCSSASPAHGGLDRTIARHTRLVGARSSALWPATRTRTLVSLRALLCLLSSGRVLSKRTGVSPSLSQCVHGLLQARSVAHAQLLRFCALVSHGARARAYAGCVHPPGLFFGFRIPSVHAPGPLV